MTTDTKQSSIPRKVAFVAMPFGKRSSNIKKDSVPDLVDFDAVWDKAIAPALEELGYDAIRADEQSGSVIIKDMLEQLVYADLVIADISVSNANVYYEAGVRHVAKEQGCVLIGTEWAQPVFDLGQIRQIRYPYGNEDINEIDFQAIKEIIKKGIESLSSSKSPVYELTDYPKPLPLDRASSFKTMACQLAMFQKKVRLARLKSGQSSKDAVLELLEEFFSTVQSLDSVAYELLTLVRDKLGWAEVIEFIEKLPSNFQESRFVQEQSSLAIAKIGDVDEAIISLEYLITQYGGTPERYGLLGGRYKSLFYDKSIEDRDYYLDQAIFNYQTGMNLDFNEYYCACNLPRLLKSRGSEGDARKAKFISGLVVEVCKLRIEENKMDGWERPTLLGAAFDAEDIEEAKAISSTITKKTQEQWYLETTLKDLRQSASLSSTSKIKSELTALIEILSKQV